MAGSQPELTMVHKRGVSLLLRTLHLVSFGILLGGHTFAIDADRLLPLLCT